MSVRRRTKLIRVDEAFADALQDLAKDYSKLGVSLVDASSYLADFMKKNKKSLF